MQQQVKVSKITKCVVVWNKQKTCKWSFETTRETGG